MAKRVIWFYVFLIGVFSILLTRLFWLQVVKGQYYRQLADENRIRLEAIKADRGVIYDRQDLVLARNAPEGREYPYGSALAHILGYLGKLTPADWQDCQQQYQQGGQCNWQLDDWLGQAGLEKQLDDRLRGQAGGILLETSAQGETTRELERIEPVAGQDLHLSLDAPLQVEAERLLAGRKGAVVASKPSTGEILVLYSSPSFDPNKLAEGGEMFNRAISGLYPPGSVFKIVTATAGLEEGKLTAETLIEDTGEIRINDYRYGNWYFDQYGQTEGQINIVTALKRSNDIFFYKAGELVGARKLADWAHLFGLGQISGIDLAGEAKGLIPDPDWKQEYKGERWFLGNTYHMAIGQGDILTTPLQINLMTNVIASGGQWCQPQLLNHDNQQPECLNLKLGPETIGLITQGMIEVCQEKGTAFPFFSFKVNGQEITVAGKTGTAQFGDPDDRTHAWFTGFLVPDPLSAGDNRSRIGRDISVTVLLEAAGEGSYQAAPVAKALFEFWLKHGQD